MNPIIKNIKVFLSYKSFKENILFKSITKIQSRHSENLECH